ncbi:response regulator transcription factor [Carboxylicivirga taeanensis]|uniref:response regulator transcription factor n=1 Tax=Carboxylicivirga taeanensis TaxID=1416875 RepID=UPI003F6E2E6B
MNGRGIEFYKKVLNHLPASVHILEIREDLAARLVWANRNYYSEIGINPVKRLDMGFLNQGSLFVEEDLQYVHAAFSEIYNGSQETKTILARINKPLEQRCWIYSRVRRIDLGDDKVYLICFLYTVDQHLVRNPNSLDAFIAENNRLKNNLLLTKLTKTELTVLSHLGQGLSTKQVAKVLYRSFNTVNNHRRSIFAKLGFHKLSELVDFAKENGL